MSFEDEPVDADNFIDNLVKDVSSRLHPSANIPTDHAEKRRNQPLTLDTSSYGTLPSNVGAQEGHPDYNCLALLTGATVRRIDVGHGKRSKKRKNPPEEEDVEEDFEKIPIDMMNYYQPLTTEDYDITGAHNFGQENSIVQGNVRIEEETGEDDVYSRLTWDDSSEDTDANPRVPPAPILTIKKLNEHGEYESIDKSEEQFDTLDTKHQTALKDMIKDKQKSEEVSKKRRKERLKEYVQSHSHQQHSTPNPQEDVFRKSDVERELLDTMKKLREIANKCLKEPKRGGNELLKRLQKEANVFASELGEVMGSSNDCFLCLFGNREFDKSTYDKVNGLYKILGSLLFKDNTIRAIAVEMYAYYQTEIYIPGMKSGLSLPIWSVEGVEKHIRLHMHDPRIKTLLTFERVSLALDILSTQITYYDEEDGKTKVNYVAMRLLENFIKLEDNLRKRNFRDMYGYDESLSIKPGQAWLNTRINVTKKKNI